MSSVVATTDPAPARTEARLTDTAALALDYADRLVLSAVRDIHISVARRVFAPARAMSFGVPETVHDAVFTAIYTGISGAVRTTEKSLRALAKRGIGAPVERSRAGRTTQAIVNGLIGAELRDNSDPATITMSLRHEAANVRLDAESLRTTFPVATGRLAIFVHGLVESDESWHLRAAEHGSTYAKRLSRDTDWTPLTLRYNTGLHVSENGEQLSGFIDDLVDAWPVPVTQIAIVGHSMGGLVARSATNHAVASRRPWVDLVTHVVCLGTPHLGAALEKIVHLGARAMAMVPEAAPVGRILDIRSPGIIDLRHGYVSRDEWDGHDLTASWGTERIAVAPLPHATYHFVAATLGSTPGHPLSEMLGDIMVRYPSAAGAGRRAGPVVGDARVNHLPSTDHFALLNHPTIADWLVEWLQTPAATSRGVRT